MHPSSGLKGGLSPKRKKPEIEEKNPSILTDPTSVTLMMSYLITNAGPAFDNFAKQNTSKKKKHDTSLG
jgi:hypothetical protein